MTANKINKFNEDLEDAEHSSNEEENITNKQKAKKEIANPDKKTRYVVFVGNLPFNINKEELTEYFSKAGNVRDVRLIKDKNDKPKGCAFVEYTNHKDFEKAFSLNHTIYKNRRINVIFSNGSKKIKGDKQKFKKKTRKLNALRDKGVLEGSKTYVKRLQNRKIRKQKQNKCK